MPSESAGKAFTDLLAKARVAVIALAPHDNSDETTHSASPQACARARHAVGDLVTVLEPGEDTVRTLLAVDMLHAVDTAPSVRDRGRLVALLLHALAVLGDEPPEGDPQGSLPSRSPLALANELRAVRGASLLSSNVVFGVAISAGAARAGGDDDAAPGPGLTESARRLRSFYQQGLVAWLRGSAAPGAAAERISDVCGRLHVQARGSGQELLWRVAASFANLLRDGRWRMSAAVKRLLGRIDGEMKRMAEPDGVPGETDPGLLQDLMFYVGEAHDVDSTLGVFPSRSALLKAFEAPPSAHPDHPTAVLSLLKETLAISGQVMEALAPGESWLTRRGWLSERMLHVADGLGLLGVHGLRHRALEEAAILQAIPGSGDPPPGGWGRMAERLHALGADLLTASGMEPTIAVAEDTAGMPSSGRIARRLEADLVHAEGVIQRLEQGREAPRSEPEDDAGEALAAATADLESRIEELAGVAVPGPDAPSAEAPSPDSSIAEAPVPGAPVDHDLLEDVARIAGDVDGARTRLEQQVGAFREGLEDMEGTLRDMREELDGLRAHADTLGPHDPADAGELPAPSGQAGRAPAPAELRERVERLAARMSELLEVRDALDAIAGDSSTVLVQQARDNVALEQRLMQTRLQPLESQLDELVAEVADRAAHAGKQVQLEVDDGGLGIEPEKMAALLPVLRSLAGGMIETGVEPPRARVLAGKSPGARMAMRFRRRGADLDMVLTSDCPVPEDVADEARAFIRPLGGRLEVVPGEPFGARCHLQIPLAPRVSTVLLVGVGSEILALPLAEVQAVLQLSREELEAGAEAGIEHGETRWRVGRLAELLALGEEAPPRPSARLPLVLVDSDGERQALVVDAIGDRVDVVVRSVVPQLRSVPGLAGAAILGDGQVVLLLDVAQLVTARAGAPAADLEPVD